jgi:uncharacterized membrane protein YbhN (UPF0104 family)
MTTTEPVQSPQQSRWITAARVATGVVLFTLVVVATARNWSEVRDTVGRMSAWELVVAELLVLAGLVASVLTWRRSLLELGSAVRPLHAAKIYLIGQLGKYVPGSFWAFLVQMELAHRVAVPRSRALAASIVAAGVAVLSGLAVGLLVIPRVVASHGLRYSTVAGLVVVFAAALSPPVLTWLVNVVMRVMRRPSLERPVTWPGMVAATGWGLLSWLTYGTGVWVLAVAAGAPAGESFLLCVGGAALAMTAGFLVFIAPSGIGIREAVLVAALSPVLDSGEALSVALVVRLAFTLADLLAAAAVLPIRLATRAETMAE